jgi:glycosyltransferase involved in cell wall biosynthesis
MSDIRLGVVTPTYRRPVLASRFVRRIRQQTHTDFRLAVVHDGPDPATRDAVARAAMGDRRIGYHETVRRCNDEGTTPRLLGVEALLREGVDYLTFWDDDDLFFPGALRAIAAALETADSPAALLVPFRIRPRVLPTGGTAVLDMQIGDVSSQDIVVRADAAVAMQTAAVQAVEEDPRTAYWSDYLAFDHLRRAGFVAGVADIDPIGLHDGLRTLQAVRYRLGVPRLGLDRWRWYASAKKRFNRWI